MQTETRLYTVGHSNLDRDSFLALLQGAAVSAVADVRSRPHSRRLPHFARAELEPFLREKGIAYVFLGGQLGGRPGDEKLYDPNERGELVVNYERVRETPSFQAGLERLRRGLERYVVAVLCAEEDPLHCHRGLMIAPALAQLGLPPLHLRKGGRIETTPEMEKRLLEETRLGEGRLDGLFPFTAEEYRQMLEKAYRLQNQRVAYRLSEE